MSEIKDIVLYKIRDVNIQLDVQLEEETVWLTLKQITSLFERDKSVISRHLANILEQVSCIGIQLQSQMKLVRWVRS